MKTILTASAMVLGLSVAVASPAFAFGPLGSMLQNVVQEQIKSVATSVTGAALNATVAAATSGTALEGNAMVGAAAAAAAGAATGQGTGAVPGVGQYNAAAAQAQAIQGSSGAGRAFLLGNMAIGAMGKGVHAAAAANGNSTGGVAYTLGSDTALNIHAMGQAYTTALSQCGQDQACSQCVMNDFQAQSASSVGKTGTYSIGGACFGTTTADKEDVAPAAGNDSVKWDN